ncbi:hypothetical protein OKA04_22105 [Luteolibacter flavescens]|uniref:DUF4340 domain-containing protein n=1 Tax=Luteolibacter flavescens TaxID=1859460 RepID=A0ABT3FV45_9BACT|nr:hypothetical protein [Luteolibacter flavescens]MCW1887446.1 hypothetical protein [Luteolibacter flavescens]
MRKGVAIFVLVLGIFSGGFIGYLAGKQAGGGSAPDDRLRTLLREEWERELLQKERRNEEEANERLKLRSGKWISADGQTMLSADGELLEFGDAPGWPDLAKHAFLVPGDSNVFYSLSGRYIARIYHDRPDEFVFFKSDRKSGSLIVLTLYREGTPHAASRPPLPNTAPPPRIQAILDLIPGIQENESVEEINRKMAEVWSGKLDIIRNTMERGESDLEFNLDVEGQWVLQRSEKENGELMRFRIVRTWVEDRRSPGGPEVERVAYPYYEFGKIITGPMQFHVAGRMSEGEGRGIVGDEE